MGTLRQPNGLALALQHFTCHLITVPASFYARILALDVTLKLLSIEPRSYMRELCRVAAFVLKYLKVLVRAETLGTKLINVPKATDGWELKRTACIFEVVTGVFCHSDT